MKDNLRHILRYAKRDASVIRCRGSYRLRVGGTQGERMMFKKILMLAMATSLMGATFVGCGKKTDESAEKAPVAEEAAAKSPSGIQCDALTVEGLVGEVKGEKATKDEMIKLIDSVQCCQFDSRLVLDNKCVAMQALNDLNKAKKLNFTPEVGDALVKHESPAVRAYIAFKNYAIWGNSKVAESIKNFTEEKDPGVLKNIADSYKNDLSKSPDLTKLVISMAKNEDARVRTSAASTLGAQYSKGVDGVLDALKTLAVDPDEAVAKAACEGLGRVGDDSAVETIVSVLNDAEKAKIHQSCARGLMLLWLDHPSYKSTNEAAYKAFLDYLNKTPRTADVPNWQAVSAANILNANANFNKWLEKATYYKPAELVAAYTAIVKDTNAARLARESAILGIGTHGTKADLEAIRSTVENDKDALMLKTKFENALKKAK